MRQDNLLIVFDRKEKIIFESNKG